jgi:hypothetical protein
MQSLEQVGVTTYLSSLISRSIRLASMRSWNTRDIRFIATCTMSSKHPAQLIYTQEARQIHRVTLRPVNISSAAATSPYAPRPIGRRFLYRSSTLRAEQRNSRNAQCSLLQGRIKEPAYALENTFAKGERGEFSWG